MSYDLGYDLSKNPSQNDLRQTMVQQAKLFEKIYLSHKHINAYVAPVDMKMLDGEKEPTLDIDNVMLLFNAKFNDLQIPETEE